MPSCKKDPSCAITVYAAFLVMTFHLYFRPSSLRTTQEQIAPTESRSSSNLEVKFSWFATTTYTAAEAESSIKRGFKNAFLEVQASGQWSGLKQWQNVLRQWNYGQSQAQSHPRKENISGNFKGNFFLFKSIGTSMCSGVPIARVLRQKSMSFGGKFGLFNDFLHNKSTHWVLGQNIDLEFCISSLFFSLSFKTFW